MTTIQEVSAMLPLLTPYSMPSDSTQAQTLYNLAGEIVDNDLPSASDLLTTRAYCYLIAHFMSAQDGSANTTSEHLGNWSATYATSSTHSSRWIVEYETLKDTFIRGSLIRGSSVVEISDVETSRRYPLDGAGYGC